MNTNIIKVNGDELQEDEFYKLAEKINKSKQEKLIKVSENEYKTVRKLYS